MRQYFVERVVPSLLGIDHKPAGLYGQTNPRIRRKIKRVQHWLRDRNHHRSTNFAKPCHACHESKLFQRCYIEI